MSKKSTAKPMQPAKTARRAAGERGSVPCRPDRIVSSLGRSRLEAFTRLAWGEGQAAQDAKSRDAARGRFVLQAKYPMHFQHMETRADRHGGDDDCFEERTGAADSDGLTLRRRPGQTQTTGREQVSSEMGQIADNQRIDDYAAHALPAQENQAGKYRNK